MAVCGHCWVCGYKFDCYPDEAVTFTCTRDTCNYDHKICIACHDAIDASDDKTPVAQALLVVLLQRASAERREKAGHAKLCICCEEPFMPEHFGDTICRPCARAR